MFDIFSLNCRGLNSPTRLIEICALVKQRKCYNNFLIALQETKLESIKTEHRRIIDHEGLTVLHVPSVGNSGGLMYLTPKEIMVKIIHSEKNYSAIHIEEMNITIINCYVTPRDIELSELKHFLEKITLPCDSKLYLVGDFNSIDPWDLNGKFDKVKANDYRITRHRNLQKILNKLQVHDVAKLSNAIEFTHYDKRANKFSRIDYIISNCLDSIPVVQTINTSFSDHKILHTYEIETECYSQSYWKMNEVDLNDRSRIGSIIQFYSSMIQNDDLVAQYELFKTRISAAFRHNAVKCAIMRKEKEQTLLNQIRTIENAIEQGTNFTYDDLNSKLTELRGIRFEYNISRLKLIKGLFLDINEGDPKLLQNLIKKKQSKQRILKLSKENGEQICDQSEILDAFHEYYNELYTETENNDMNSTYVKNITDRIFSNQEKASLSQDLEEDDLVSEHEVEKAIEKLNKDSAPGLDGLPSNLYKSQKELFIPLLTRLYNEIILSKSYPESLKYAVIKLIQKNTSSVSINNFRPISLINTDQKILSHILAERLREPLNKIIGTHQSAYLPNRSMHTSILKIRKAVNEIKKDESIVAIDFSKAFDKLNRNFMFNILDRLQISENTLKLIKIMYSETYSFLDIDGFLSTPLNISKGVRQGCPLSALLFIMSIEPLLQK